MLAALGTIMSCYEECDCNCGQEGKEFDRIILSETNFDVTASQLAHSSMGWFCGFDDLHDNQWPISKDGGVYLLWEKNDYCPVHENFHSKALYVGKGRVKARIYAHAKNKGFTEENIVYFTFLEMPNRKSKYIEQLLLDLYDFPLNRAENNGRGKLCAYISQEEADFGS
ncbi:MULTISPECIES: hypothetical protein [unclassified Halomonas]|uniref:hypothetical protein n=1 Tax=unclassified Halomonas TaxID=2609666 RepID=UPI0020767144|nr:MULTISPECIES: hypothetical protein [unclassified Halomonas]